MNRIQLFVTHTPNSNNKCIEGKYISNVLAGAVYQKNQSTLIRDDSGDNISARNKSFCELTTQYWAWKNTDYDYYGFCHYRRLFSFSPFHIPENDWGTIEYPYLNDSAIDEIHFDDESIESLVPKYDFIIAKGININLLREKSVRSHYYNARELFKNDYNLMLDIIKEKYPKLYPYALEYSDGKVYYPCNMFIMKKEIFNEYSDMLFDILFEFERKADIKNYSVQSYRVTGHLAERILGMFYLYCKKEKKLRMHELQVALFKNTEKEVPSYKDNNDAIPIVLASDDNYVPMLSTTICSIIDNVSESRKYEIFVLHRNITDTNKKIICDSVSKNNISIEFVDINGMVADYQLKGRMHITAETFYRFLILDILKDYHKAIYIDCDLVVCDDLAKLYDTDIGNNLVAAVKDADFNGQLNIPETKTLDYAKKVLRLDKPYDYFQAGVLLLNIEEFRKVSNVSELLEIASKDVYRYSDQDMLNVFCQGRVFFLDMSWNHMFDNEGTRIKNVVSWASLPVYEGYMEARKHPRIIHYAGHVKPWIDAESEFGNVFWKYAKMTPYYEVLIQRLIVHVYKKNMNAKTGISNEYFKRLENAAKKENKKSLFTKATYLLLPEDSKRRDNARKWYYKHFGVPEYDEFGNRKRS